MVETFLLSITSFVGTNIDDIFINTLFFAGARTKADRRNIVIGKYLGIGGLILLSILGAFGLQFLPQQYIGCFGLVPMGLGIREMIAAFKSGKTEAADKTAKKSANKVLNTALITMANGADNIGVYIPLFAGFAVWQMLFATGVFLVLIAVWCLLGKLLANLPIVKNVIETYKAVIVPLVYIALGVYILLKNLM